MKKRLLITTDCFLPRVDGIAIYLRNLLPYLAKKFDITIIAPKFRGELPKVQAKIIQIPLGFKIADLGIAQFQYRKIKKLVDEHDIVLNHTLGTIGGAAIRAAKKLKKPIASYVHSYEEELFALSVNKFKSLVRWITKRYVRYSYNGVSKLIFPSKEVKESFYKKKIKTSSEIIEVKIPLNRFIPRYAKRKIPVIGYCGRLGREKGLNNLIKAFNKVKEKHKVKLLIVGDGLRSIRRKARRVGAKVTGQVTDTEKYYQKMDIFVLPSLTETTSLSTMEAMSCGLPIIATPVGKVPEFISRSKGGVLVPKSDPDAIANAISHMIKNPSLRARYAKNSRIYALSHFDIKNSAKKLIALLESIKA